MGCTHQGAAVIKQEGSVKPIQRPARMRAAVEKRRPGDRPAHLGRNNDHRLRRARIFWCLHQNSPHRSKRSFGHDG